MKKIFIILLLIILVPYIVVSNFIKNDEINFNYINNYNIRVKRVKKNQIEEIPFEEYIVGVLAGEMPVSFHIEALKAQAVAARSYALKKIDKNKEYDVVDTIDNQVYLDDDYLKEKWKNNYQENINKIRKAVLETKGQYLVYNDKIIDAFFFSTSNGKTENCEEVFVQKLPYLKSVDSSWEEKLSPVYRGIKELSLSDFYNKLNLEYNENLTIKILEYTTSGSIKSIKINNKIYKGTDIRYKLNLNSTYFTLKKVNKNVVIETKGKGHGVGMSQYGALGMANEGYRYDEILKYYYTNVEIKKI